MLKRTLQAGLLLSAMLAVGAFGYLRGYNDRDAGKDPGVIKYATAQAGQQQQLIDPTEAMVDRDAYYPGTEELGPEEMRIISCGTGMPSARESQAAPIRS